MTDFLADKTQKKLIECALTAKLSPDQLLNHLIDDEIERQRLLAISAEIKTEASHNNVASQKIAKLCNQHLSILDYESESLTIRTAIESLYQDLLNQKILYVNSRKGCIVESKRLKTSRIDYYWYTSILAKQIGMCFGTIHVYLFHELFNPVSEVVFIGMPTNVEVCCQVFRHLCKLFKKIQSAYQKDAGMWGSKKEMENECGRYMYEFAQELDHTQAYIENEDYSKHLYDYATQKFSWALR